MLVFFYNYLKIKQYAVSISSTLSFLHDEISIFSSSQFSHHIILLYQLSLSFFLSPSLSLSLSIYIYSVSRDRFTPMMLASIRLADIHWLKLITICQDSSLIHHHHNHITREISIFLFFSILVFICFDKYKRLFQVLNFGHDLIKVIVI